MLPDQPPTVRQVSSGHRLADGWFVPIPVCAFFTAFLVRRAVRVSLTYDEAASYLKFVRADVFSLFNFTWATNHFLNTVLARMFCRIGGHTELMLRMPALIGYAVFCWFSVLVLRSVSHRAIALAGLLLLNLNPYMLDYFALSRGYGLWLGLQMAIVYFLLRFLAALRAGRDTEAARALSRALTCAIGAVVANVAALNVYLSVFAIAVIVCAFVKRRDGAVARQPAGSSSSRRMRPLPWIVGAVFSALVFSQDVRLSPMLYERIAVTLTGVTVDEAASVAVVRNDVHNHPQNLPRHGTSWLMPLRANATGLRIETPAAIADRIEAITVRLGDRTFTDDLRRPGEDWTAHDEGGTRVLESGPALSLQRSRLTSFRSIINYRSGPAHAAYAIGRAALFLVAMAIIALVIAGAGVVAARAGLVRPDEWRVLGSSALWLTAVAAVPTYLLVRDNELGFGEPGSVLQAVRDFVDALFYGHVYRDGQIDLALALGATAALVCAVTLIAGYRRRGYAALMPLVAVVSLIVLVVAILVTERILFGSPYPLGRTAVYFVPLCGLAAIFALDAIAGIGARARGIASAIATAVVVVAAIHFTVTANVSSTEDWPYDVDTKRMMDDLGRFVAAEYPAPSRAVLAVYWLYWPAASVYASWDTDARIAVAEESAPGPRDFVYVREGEALPPRAFVVKRYPAAAGLLARIR